MSRNSSSGRLTSKPVYIGRFLWQPPLWYTLRTTAVLCIHRAVSGSSSQTSTPGALVAIGLNSLRMPSGASGFRSNMSCVGGPPCR